MSEEDRNHSHVDAGVAESAGNTDIDLLVGARSQAETPLYRFPDGFSVLIADLMGTPEFFERFGETALLVMLQQHSELVVPIIHETGGTVVRSVGDTAIVLFPDAREASRAAFHVADRVEKYNASKPTNERFWVRLGLGLASGSAEDSSLFDATVAEVAEVVKQCRAGQILATAEVQTALSGLEGIESHSVEGASGQVGLLKWVGDGAAPPITRQVISVTPTPASASTPTPATAAEGAATGDSADNEQSGSSKRLGRYEIQEEIGVGGMGVVYKAYDPTVGRSLAIKTVRLDAQGPERDEMVHRLRQEAQAAGRLEHPAIVTVYDAGEDKGVFYMAMQFVEGKVLGSFLTERALLPVNQILTVMEEVCSGLHYAHERGIVHRDIKPGNIILTPEGRPKVLDFGIAKLTETGTTRAGTILGTPNYMSPEQAAGSRVDRRSDIFSLGAVLYELLTSERAFAGNSAGAVMHKIREEQPVPVRKIDPTISPELEGVVKRALDKDPFKRYQNAEDMQKALAGVRVGKASGARPAASAPADATVVMTAAPAVAAATPAVAPPADVGFSTRPAAALASRAAAHGRKPAVAKPTTPVSGVRPFGQRPQQRSKSRVSMPTLLILLAVLSVTSFAAVGVYQGWLSGSELYWVSNSEVVPLETLQQLPWIGKYFEVSPPGAAQQAGVGGAAGERASLLATPEMEQPTPPPETLGDSSSTSPEGGAEGISGDAATGVTPAETIPPPPVADGTQRRNLGQREQIRAAMANLAPEDQARVRRWLRQAEQFLDRNQLPQAEIALKRIFEVVPEHPLAEKLQVRLRRIRKGRRN